MMAKSLWADLASGFFSAGSFQLRHEWFTWKIISVSNEVFTKWVRHIKLKYSFLYNTKFLREYEKVIFSGDCLAAVKNCGKDTKKIYYCHTPPRYLYDLKDVYLEKIPFLIKPAFHIISILFRRMYESDLQKFDQIICNSANTAKRLKHFTGHDSQILYPPVDLEKFTYKPHKNYYVSASRVATAKRINHIVEAFLQMPDKNIIIIYGKNDPQKQEIFNQASGAKNIQFKTFENNIGFYDCIAESIAGICVPMDEDFWMTPVESMAAGKPMIGVNEWGIKESIIDGETGFLIPEGAPVDSIINAVEKMTPDLAISMKIACEQRAKEFSLDQFDKRLKDLITKK